MGRTPSKRSSETGPASTSCSKKRRRAKEKFKASRQLLTMKDVQLVCEELEDVDMEELRGDVYRQIESSYHMLFFNERLNLWQHIKSTNVMALDSVIATVLTDAYSAIYIPFSHRNHAAGDPFHAWK